MPTQSSRNQQIELSPSSVQAHVFSFIIIRDQPQAQLSLKVEGREDGVRNIHIEPVDLNTSTPVFKVVGEPSAAIGDFPYQVERVFELANPDINEVLFQTPQGLQKYPVEHIPSSELQEAQPEALRSLSSTQTVGYAFHSANLDQAFANGVHNLRRQKGYSNVVAKVADSGYVAINSPRFRTSFTYVILDAL